MAHSSLFQNTEYSSKSIKDRLGELRNSQTVVEVIDGLLQKIAPLEDKVNTATNAVTDLAKLSDLKDASREFAVLTSNLNAIRNDTQAEHTAENTSTLQPGQ